MKWEYDIVIVDLSALILKKPNASEDKRKEINKKGEEGWELMAVRSAGEHLLHVLYFKRPKQ